MKDRYKHSQIVALSNEETITVEHDYTHSAPLPNDRREEIYRRQNGYHPLTQRQWRQEPVPRLRAIGRKLMTAHATDDWVERASKQETPTGPFVVIGWIACLVLACLAPAVVIAGWRWLL